MKKIYDVIVVGAGPAGSVAARRAAEAGFATLLIEKRQEIGAPVRCAEAIGADLTRQFIDLDDRWIDARITHFKVVNSQGEGANMPPAEPTLVINRKVFDYQLALLAARAGAEVFTSTCAEGVILEDGAVRGVRLRCLDECHEVRARLVIAADGVESQVARWAGLKTTPKPADYYVSAGFLLAGMAGVMTPSVCEYHLNHELAPGGYLWVFPKGVDTANVGLVIPANQHSAGQSLAALRQFVTANFPSTRVMAVISGGIPISGALKQMVMDGLMVVGDAAHQADPLMAGGINLGMTGAALAMEVAISALSDNDLCAKRLQAYEKAWQERFGKMHAALYRIRSILGHMEQGKLDALVHTTASLPLEKMSLGQVVFNILKNHPSLLFEARTLITTGLIMK